MGMILRIASSRIVGQGDIVGRSGYFSLNLSANSVMRGRLDARRTLKSLVADLRTFRSRAAKDKRNNVLFTSYLPAISKKSVSRIHETIKSWNLKRLHNRSLRFVAAYINDVVRGWINYYEKFGKTEFWKVMCHLNRSIAYWAKTKYKRLRRRGVISAHYWLAYIAQKEPNLFYHWQVGYVPYARQKK